MKHYLILLNALLVCVFIGGTLWITPIWGGWPFSVGLFAGGMFTAGMISWQFDKDQSPDKEYKWRKGFFRKDYPLEILVQTVLLAVSYGLSFLFLRRVFVFFTGFFGIWFLNMIIEWIWAYFHHYYNNR